MLHTVVANGNLLTDPKDVCAQFRDYNAELYRSKTHKSIGEISGVLDTFPLPSLTRDTSADLNSLITEEEMQRAIGWMAMRK